MEKQVAHLVKWLQESVASAKAKGALVGVSGGLDSAVVANLIKRAFPEDSLGVILPVHSSEIDLIDAREVVDQCKISNLKVDLSASHDLLFSTIKTDISQELQWKESAEQIGDANTRARLRMTTLYAIANNFNYLVIGTDNAAEWYTGYFTKYGDGGVDLNPLVHLLKKDVVAMARYLGVPEQVIRKQPTAGLWEGQTDESEMGTSYEMIDKFLLGEEIPKQDRLLIERMHERSEHKRKIVKSPPKLV